MQPIPTINVNLRPCGCPVSDHEAVNHYPSCPIANPVPIPLDLAQWRSVTFTVRLGECVCGGHIGRGPPAIIDRRSVACPGLTTRVACSIRGKTWPEAEISDFMYVDGRDWANEEEADKALDQCIARWEIVKALVTGKDPRHDVAAHAIHTLYREHRLFENRNAVFSEVAELDRLEQAAYLAQERGVKALGEPAFLPRNFIRAEPSQRASADLLARWAERMIEQVGVLP